LNILLSNRDFSSWKGGLNYYNNLLRALRYSEYPFSAGLIRSDFPVFLDETLIDNQHSGFNHSRFSKNWFKRQVLKPFVSGDRLLKVCHPWINNYDVSFNSNNELLNQEIPSISWIPDFQHVHLPTNFTSKEIENRNKGFKHLANKSDVIIVSSQHAANTFAQLYPDFADKAQILHFEVFLPLKLKDFEITEMLQKYNLPQKYIYLPNQYWKHKNHKLVIEALKLNSNKSLPLIVSSGSSDDYRNPDYFDSLKEEFEHENVRNRYRYLGEIPYEDVQTLMLGSQAVLNPSLYEGWSTTVQEAKAFGKKLILSNIEVHQEQAVDADAIFFDPHNPDELLNALYKTENTSTGIPDIDFLHERSKKRLKRVGNRFYKIAKMAINTFNQNQ